MLPSCHLNGIFFFFSTFPIHLASTIPGRRKSCMWQRHPFRSADDVARRKRETFSWKKVTIGRAIATGWKQLVERITGFIPPPTESLPSVYDENSTIFPRLISPTEITCCCCRLSPFYRLLSCSSSSKALDKEEGTTAPSSGQT